MKWRKTYRCVILSLILYTVVGLLLAGTACTQTSTYVKILPRPKTVATEETFTLNVTLDPAPAHAIAGVQFDISFDPTLITADSIVEGNLFNEGCAATFFRGGTIDNEEGTITDVVCVITEPGCTVATTGIVATITFTAKQSTGTSTLTLSNIKVGNSEGTGLASLGYTGTVEVSPP